MSAEHSALEALLARFRYRPDEEMDGLVELPASAVEPEQRRGRGGAAAAHLRARVRRVRGGAGHGDRDPPGRTLTEIPRARPPLLGVLNLRRIITPVYDPSLRLGLASRRPGLRRPRLRPTASRRRASWWSAPRSGRRVSGSTGCAASSASDPARWCAPPEGRPVGCSACSRRSRGTAPWWTRSGCSGERRRPRSGRVCLLGGRGGVRHRRGPGGRDPPPRRSPAGGGQPGARRGRGARAWHRGAHRRSAAAAPGRDAAPHRQAEGHPGPASAAAGWGCGWTGWPGSAGTPRRRSGPVRRPPVSSV